jgi:hypothetical protein
MAENQVWCRWPGWPHCAHGNIRGVDLAFRYGSADVAEWLQRLSAGDRDIVTILRGIISQVAPDAHETVYHGALGYGPTDSGFDRILYISVFNDHINLGLFYGAGLPDPDGLLRGSGKQMRHVKLTSPQSLPVPAIRQLLELAWPDGLARVQGRHASKRR